MHESDSERPITIDVEGRALDCLPDESVASALLAAGLYTFGRHRVDGTPRGPFCMSGACQSCLVRADGVLQLACQIGVREGQVITLDGEA